MESNFDTYLSRVANVQDTSALSPPDMIGILLPSKRDLFITIPTVSIGLLESYELRKCHLFHLVAEKNSILGKVQDAFRNFDYQIELSLGLEKCLLNPELSQSLKTELTAIEEQKFLHLPSHFSNMVFTSDAMRQQLEGFEWITTSEGPSRSAIFLAIQEIDAGFKASLGSIESLEHRQLNRYQETLHKNPMLGKLSYSMLNATNWLNVITQQLENHDTAIICGQGRDTTKFRYLRNVFNEYYIGRIQPYLAQVDSMFLDLEPYLAFTDSTHPNYQYPIKPLHQAFRSETLAHVQYWQRLFKRCGVSPS
ncbi:DUF3080 domain-containing protein [Vibrio ostreicida]|nr:DUF3080 domain-containing protein [Vibrio ostreicida]